MIQQRKHLPLIFTLFIIISGTLFLYHTYQMVYNQPIVVEPIVSYQPSSGDAKSLQQIIHHAQKSVVKISVDTSTSNRLGSGFLYNSRGDIITNAHVIEGANTIEVTLSSTETYPAAIVGMSKEKDIAVIRVPQLMNQRPIELNTTDDIEVGTPILALGSPLGYQNSVSVGIISGTNRSFDINGYAYDEVYQISSNITHGNSGGPLIDQTTGKVIGINSAGISDTDIGFSIPIKDVIDDITDWSANTSNDALTFPSNIHQRSDQIEDYQENSYYLIQYFIESLAIHDYINAYALLGNDKQSAQDYIAFRDKYVSLKTLHLVEQVSAEVIDNQWVFNVLIEKALLDEDTEILDYTFTIAFENDQIKIIEYTLSEST
ncbi:peptidase S1 [Halolactibacillus alkaliphilus]|uniref:Peptidase S1 n=1 Tax=Halolactibacillus alkaliphilus TaxID=442899 RepID=A0A511X3M3_9BACI|nr:trypsin-like peptidase domain-containing protein [Halolactibacillus alkaliphilus]GEN57527.1 peptidase S1 [Halolactibacillus alkaliphilus]GGN73639.1 peptidase S1 [Halolactibacillus alkaliphilus]SFO97838.1 Trypsin-like peptidase domain-containing protein [Halolactibacillus alkaliphilus]